MGDYDNFLRTQKELSKQLQTYFNSPMMKALIDQQKIAQAISSSMKNVISNSDINFTYKRILDINASLAQNISKVLKLSDEESKNISRLVLSAQLTDSFSPLLTQHFKELSHTASFEPLLENIAQIKMHENYVSIPETLIPDGFDYTEVNSQPEESFTEKSNVKHLAYTNAIALLAIIIPFLCWIITCIREDISSQQEQQRHDEIIAIQKEANRLQEEENQILQKQLEISESYATNLFAIYQQLQESGLTALDIDSCTQCVPLQSEPDHQQHSTEVDELENSEQYQMPEQQ